MNGNLPQDRNAALLVALYASLVQAAWMQLGKVRNEITGKVERQLDAARVTIDTLAALEARTRGNRSEEETRFLEHALSELRLNYVDELKKPDARPEAETAPGS